MEVLSARPKFLSKAVCCLLLAVSVRHGRCATATTGYRQEGWHAGPVPTTRLLSSRSRRSRRFPFTNHELALSINHQNRTRAPTSLYKCTGRATERGVASIRAPAAGAVRAGGLVSGVVLWSHPRSSIRTPGPFLLVRARRGRGRGGFEARTGSVGPGFGPQKGRVAPVRCCARRPAPVRCVAVVARRVEIEERGRGDDGAVHARILRALTARCGARARTRGNVAVAGRVALADRARGSCARAGGEGQNWWRPA